MSTFSCESILNFCEIASIIVTMNVDIQKANGESSEEPKSSEKTQLLWDSILLLTKKIHTCIVIAVTFAGISGVDPEKQFEDKHKTDTKHHVKIVRDKKRLPNT